MNSLILIIMDSCRYDAFMAASTPNTERFCTMNGVDIEKRYSYASWTAPSHYVFLMGALPHTSPAGVFASEVYREDFLKWSWRLGIEGMDFSKFLPQLSLPRVLNEHGYNTIARVSLPVLNETTLLSRYFDDYALMDDHNDFKGMVEQITFRGRDPYFYFFNLGETHYPYMLDDPTLPRVSGVHGVFKQLAGLAKKPTEMGKGFDDKMMTRLRAQQITCAEYVDSLLDPLFRKCPDGTHIILTADHGELFGEEGFFGHGPIMHEKVFEVPFVEGKLKGWKS